MESDAKAITERGTTTASARPIDIHAVRIGIWGTARDILLVRQTKKTFDVEATLHSAFRTLWVLSAATAKVDEGGPATGQDVIEVAADPEATAGDHSERDDQTP